MPLSGGTVAAVKVGTGTRTDIDFCMSIYLLKEMKTLAELFFLVVNANVSNVVGNVSCISVIGGSTSKVYHKKMQKAIEVFGEDYGANDI